MINKPQALIIVFVTLIAPHKSDQLKGRFGQMKMHMLSIYNLLQRSVSGELTVAQWANTPCTYRLLWAVVTIGLTDLGSNPSAASVL